MVLGSCFSENCSPQDVKARYTHQTIHTTFINTTTNVLNSLISFLHVQGGDLTEEITHTNLDKKVFSRLFYGLRYDDAKSIENPQQGTVATASVLKGRASIDYYVYALQKIVI